MIVSMKHDWLNWLCTWVVTKGSWVQTLEILNGTYVYGGIEEIQGWPLVIKGEPYNCQA